MRLVWSKEDNACWAFWGKKRGIGLQYTYLTPLRGAATRGCEWAQTRGWLESWWHNTPDLRLKTPSEKLTHSMLNCSKVKGSPLLFLFLFFSRDRKVVTHLSLNAHGTGLMFGKDCCSCCIRTGPWRSHKAKRETAEAKQTARSEKEGGQSRTRARARVCVQRSSALHLKDFWVTLSFRVLAYCFSPRNW